MYVEDKSAMDKPIFSPVPFPFRVAVKSDDDADVDVEEDFAADVAADFAADDDVDDVADELPQPASIPAVIQIAKTLAKNFFLISFPPVFFRLLFFILQNYMC